MTQEGNIFGFMGNSKKSSYRLISTAKIDDVVKQTIPIALETCLGERADALEVGSTLSSFVFRRSKGEIAGELEQAVQAAILQSEPRIQLLAVTCKSSEKDANVINIQVEYRVGSSSQVKRTVNHLFVLHPNGDSHAS